MRSLTELTPCPNVQCQNWIDFTEVECYECWDKRPLEEKLDLSHDSQYESEDY